MSRTIGWHIPNVLPLDPNEFEVGDSVRVTITQLRPLTRREGGKHGK